MLKISTYAASACAVLTLIGCSTAPVEPAGPPPPPKLDPVPAVRDYRPRTIPPAQSLSMTVTFPQEPTDAAQLAEGVTTRIGYEVPAGATVVISVPVQEQQREVRLKATGLGGAGGDNEGFSGFKTTGFFNKAEQQIERSLLAKGFAVLDRSKFEAQLRDQRVETRSTIYNEAKKAEIQAASDKKDSGVFTIDQWAVELALIEKKYQAREKGGGRKAGESKELVDIAELIRAAQAGQAQADFILQVNISTTGSIADKVEHLIDHTSVSDACAANPGLRSALDRQGSLTIVRPGFFCYLNAKLIDVQTGAIVWVGEHRVETLNVLEGGFQVTIPASSQVLNGEEINREIAAYNKDVKKLRADTVQLKRAIEAGNFVIPEVNQRVAEFNQANDRMSQLNAGEGPDALRTKFAYGYVVESVEMRPELPTAADLYMVQARYDSASSPEAAAQLAQEYRRYEEFLTGYYSDLAKMVASELIATIPSEE